VQRDDCPELKNAKKLHHVEWEPPLLYQRLQTCGDLHLPTAIVLGTHENQPIDSEPCKSIVKQDLDVDFFRLGHVAVLMHCLTGPNEAAVRHGRAQSHVAR